MRRWCWGQASGGRGEGGDGEGFFWEAGLAVIFYDDEGVHANVYILILTEPIVIVRYLRVNN